MLSGRTVCIAGRFISRSFRLRPGAFHLPRLSEAAPLLCAAKDLWLYGKEGPAAGGQAYCGVFSCGAMCKPHPAAAQTGLAEGTPVICGTGDSTSEAISVGIVKPGRVMFQFGSSLFFYYCADHMVYDHRIHGGNFTVPGTYSVSGGTNTAGTLTRWMRDTLYFDLMDGSTAEPYAEMMERVRDIPPGSGGLVVLPYFAGERCPVNDEKARGVIFGLTLEHTREHIYHAALEGIGFSVAQNIAVMEEIGLPVDMVTVVGGGTKNPVWMQIVADILGKPLSIPKVSIGASYGCALLAALGTGALHSFDELAAVIKPGRVVQPDAKRHSQYEKIRHIYDSLYPATRGLMHEL